MQYIEQKIEDLYSKLDELSRKMESVQKEEKWVSVKELARIMGISPNTIYLKVRNGDIYASKKFGAPRIPLSQFYQDKTVDEKVKKLDTQSSLKERIFAE